MRLNLACVLMAPADLLLLDEPTNHLDLDAVLWLERQLLRHPAIQIIVSHDRDFLDRVATACLVIEDGQLHRYPGGYSASELIRAEHAAQRERARKAQQQRVEHLNAYITRFRAQATKARQAQSRLKALERMQVLAPVRAVRGIDFAFHEPPPGPDPLIRAAGLACGYRPDAAGDPRAGTGRAPRRAHRHPGAQRQRQDDADPHADRRTAGARGRTGACAHHAGGYLAQQRVDELRADESPLQQMARLAPAEREQVLRGWLGQFGFSGDDAMRPVGPMSGGEKARLGLAMLVWGKPGFLVLDEPTNHLDATTRDALADALADFDGPLLLVSHDRYLLRATVDEFFLVDQGALQAVRRRPRRLCAMAAAGSAGTASAADGGARRAPQRRRRGATAAGRNGDRRAMDARASRGSTRAATVPRPRAAANALRQPLEKRIRQIEDAAGRNQARAAEIDRQLAAPDAYADREAATSLGRERARLSSDIQRLEDEWLQLHANWRRSAAATERASGRRGLRKSKIMPP